jgi:hypothetical protein
MATRCGMPPSISDYRRTLSGGFSIRSAEWIHGGSVFFRHAQWDYASLRAGLVLMVLFFPHRIRCGVTGDSLQVNARMVTR